MKSRLTAKTALLLKSALAMGVLVAIVLGGLTSVAAHGRAGIPRQHEHADDNSDRDAEKRWQASAPPKLHRAVSAWMNPKAH
jgi:hypothetical protein